MKTIILILGILFCITPNIAQENFISQNSLWLKNENYKFSNKKSSTDKDLKNHFNFNPIVSFSNAKVLKKNKNLISKQSSLFVVFKSTAIEENSLLTIERGTLKVDLSTQKLVCDKEVLLNKGQAKNGVLLSYLFNKNSLFGKKNGTLTFNDMLFEDKELNNQLIELLYFPRYVTTKEKDIIESYLSIKYGISLDKEKNYYNSKGDTLWNAKNNNEFNHRITGIGKDLQLGLFQKQSRNSLHDGLTIGLNKIKNTNEENDGNLSDRIFLIWGDNNKNTLLEKEVSRKKIQRVWKVHNISDSLYSFNTQIKFDKKEVQLETKFDEKDTDFMWLAIDDSGTSNFNYDNATYVKATINSDKELVFDNVLFESNTDYLFTIVKAPENIATKGFSYGQVPQTSKPNIITDGNYTIFPNPVMANEPFTILFNLKKASNISIQITDIGGRILKNKSLGLVESLLYKESLSAAGTYLIIINIDGKVETTKIIVK